MGTLKMCQQAQDQLQNAINTVVKAEQQLRENTREVRNAAHLQAFLFVYISIFFSLKYENMSIVYNGLSQLLNKGSQGLCVSGKKNPKLNR